VKLAVVIVHYNSSDDLRRCLESLVAYAPAQEHRVIIVDNASEDQGLAEVHGLYSEFQWIFSKENLGYSKGCNLGMAQVDAEYYLLLNPDIVVQPGALQRLLEFADQTPRAGMVGPQLLNEDLSVQDSCRRFYNLKTLLLRRTFLGKIFPNSETVRLHLMGDFDHQSVRPVDWVLGGCILVRKSAMQRTGPMDERFFLYFEDVDWCYRMWQAGYEVLYTPDARFIHRHRRDSAQGKFTRTFWLHLGSLISFYEKWGILVWLLKKWRGPLLLFLLWGLDILGLTAAFGAAYGLRSLMGRFFTEELYPFSEYQPLLLFSLLLASLTFLLTGRYRTTRHRRRRSILEHLQQVGVVAILLLAATYLGHLDVISRAVLLMFIPLLFVSTALGDVGVSAIVRRLEKGHLSLERTLLVGDPRRLQAWLAQAGNLTDAGVDVAGYVWQPQEGEDGLPPLSHGEIPWLGTAGNMVETVHRYRIGQVVFWDRPTGGDDSWLQLAGLRRLRVGLRWNVEDVWLLASGARVEDFAGGLSAVQSHGSSAAIKSIMARLGSFLFGGIMVLFTLPFWLWLRGVRIARGSARLVSIRARDLWGNDPRLDMAVDRGGRVLSLPWQFSLMLSLVSGKVRLLGPRAVLGAVRFHSEDPREMADFWKDEPGAPGLTGSWTQMPMTHGANVAKGPVSLFSLVKQLWCDPGGFGVIGNSDAAAGIQDEAPSGQEVS
jgi:N-acetylglucosaminyl-diphospho-decaprenol L-rhamnosyltransferase